MSYNITFKVKVEGTDTYIPVGYCDANITWNVGAMIRASTGLPWINEANNGFVKDVIPRIEAGLHELRHHPDKYMELESPNDWGTIEGTKMFFERILRSWEELKLWEGNEIANVTTFWIG